MSEVKQSRITLKNLKVANFASEETLCFKAIVLFDGEPIGEAQNQGHGGMTNIHPLEGKNNKLDAAEAFARSLPPLTSNFPDPHDPFRKQELPMSLDFLVDLLASEEQAEKEHRQRFNRVFGKKLLFVTGDEIRYPKGVNLTLCTADEIKRYCAQIRKVHGPDTRILSELPKEEAFALWKSFLLKQAPKS
jgi:hypothetical protein